jgi:putative molybdopterin biosynthesis protein
MARTVYLADIPLEEAVERFESLLRRAGVGAPLPAEEVPLDNALGRVTAGPVWARASAPHYHAAAMDGIAVKAADTQGASEQTPIRLRLDEQAHWIDTGDALPPGADAVIMIEQIHHDKAAGTVEIMGAAAPFQHVRPLGEDIVATELVLPSAHRIRAVDLGALAAAGLRSVPVRRRPRVAVIPTGSELVPAGEQARPGEIIESNSFVLAGLVEEAGGVAARFPIVRDDRGLLRQAVLQALETHDLLLVNAGSSAGREDFTADVVRELGEVAAHGIAIRPGHPVVLGAIRGKPIVGVPGYPVSAVLVFELLVRPLLARLAGEVLAPRPVVQATVTRKLLSPMGEDEYVRVSLARVDGRWVAAPLHRGAGVMMSLVRADGLLRIPRFSEGVHAGAQAEVELLRPVNELEQTILAVGSHELTLDLLADALRARGRRLSSANVGSLAGLVALNRGESHLAGCHLLDETTGTYNLPFIRRVLAGKAVAVAHLARREQGLMVAPGNPHALASLADLARPGLRYVNRQRGAGTRILLDLKLKELGIRPDQIHGYEREEFTHLAVAAAVQSGGADAGLGIRGAARALGLDFVPLYWEDYQLVMPKAHLDDPLLAPLLETLRDPAYRKRVESIGGYDVADMGSVVAEL